MNHQASAVAQAAAARRVENERMMTCHGTGPIIWVFIERKMTKKGAIGHRNDHL